MPILLVAQLILKLVFDQLEYRYKLKRWEVSPKTQKFDTPPALFFFFFLGDTITPKTFFKGVTGDPGGSCSVSFDTDRC